MSDRKYRAAPLSSSWSRETKRRSWGWFPLDRVRRPWPGSSLALKLPGLASPVARSCPRESPDSARVSKGSGAPAARAECAATRRGLPALRLLQVLRSGLQGRVQFPARLWEPRGGLKREPRVVPRAPRTLPRGGRAGRALTVSPPACSQSPRRKGNVCLPLSRRAGFIWQKTEDWGLYSLSGTPAFETIDWVYLLTPPSLLLPQRCSLSVSFLKHSFLFFVFF